MKVMFIHGYDSSNQTNKFTAIKCTQNKFCETVDYRNNTFDEVEKIYDDLIKKENPTILVGHSLGGFWSLYMSNKYGIPCVVINPTIAPSKLLPLYKDKDLQYNDMLAYTPRAFHIELGDEILNMHEVYTFADNINSIINVFDDGFHRVKYLDNIDKLIKHVDSYRHLH